LCLVTFGKTLSGAYKTIIPEYVIRIIIEMEAAHSFSYAEEIASSAGGGFAKTSPNVIAISEATKQSRTSPLIFE
jgi:hypothetical protein